MPQARVDSGTSCCALAEVYMQRLKEDFGDNRQCGESLIRCQNASYHQSCRTRTSSCADTVVMKRVGIAVGDLYKTGGSLASTGRYPMQKIVTALSMEPGFTRWAHVVLTDEMWCWLFSSNIHAGQGLSVLSFHITSLPDRMDWSAVQNHDAYR
ncbi:hypothetical protein DSL72_003167 [Monilinia vaccinii-corymbosi]|uniref:Uncharacterized protein n=1 Tax=Monilinia vaccinii-corymbosi TaxID=61207 RepID=A0A8A3P5E7_9HELO|nr:hypothetical protein DSL72_003167 [Monilinia vaccinii-corymbosi]